MLFKGGQQVNLCNTDNDGYSRGILNENCRAGEHRARLYCARKKHNQRVGTTMEVQLTKLAEFVDLDKYVRFYNRMSQIHK